MSKNNYSGLASLIAALLSSVPERARRAVVASALSAAHGNQVPVIKIATVLPADQVNVELGSSLFNSMAALWLAVPSVGEGSSVQSLLAAADALVSGTPFVGDPASVGSASVPAIKVLNSALSASPEAFDLSDPMVRRAARTLAEYDCAEHTFVLGGEPTFWSRLVNGVMKAGEFISGMMDINEGNDQSKEALAIHDAGLESYKQVMTNVINTETQLVNQLFPDVSEGEKRQLVRDRVEDYLKRQILPNDTSVPAASSVQQNLDDTKEQLGSKIAAYRNQISQLSNGLSEAKTKAEESSRDIARAEWASAILGCDADVADLLSSVQPYVSKPSDLINTISQLVESARGAGTVSTLSAISAMTKALMGDPKNQETMINPVVGMFGSRAE